MDGIFQPTAQDVVDLAGELERSVGLDQFTAASPSPTPAGLAPPQMPAQQAPPMPAQGIAPPPQLATGGAAPEPPLHVGPIMSIVPGRTDNHHMKVPAGSYVLPAAFISGGAAEGNSIAGLKAMDDVFGSSNWKPSAEIEPVEVMLSGGEYVIDPDAVRQVGNGSLKNGHTILDKWVMDSRKKLVSTLKKLPPPAKD